jgi:hypothetical protein
VRAAARFFFVPALLISLVGAGVLAARAPAEVVDLPPPTDCHEYPLAPDGTRRQTFDAFNPSFGLAALPPRTETKLLPGQSATYCIGFQNRSSKLADLDLEVADVAADDEGVPSSQRDAEDRGASNWVTLPTKKILDLKSGDIAWLEVKVAVPDDALAGSSYASVLATDATPPPKLEGSGVQALPSIGSQLFFDIPGNAVRQGKVTGIRSPRLIWWDGFGLGDLPVLGKFRGLGVATVHFGWRNTGDYTSDIGGRVKITSDLSGKDVTSIDLPQQVVLRGSERDFAITWKDDIPLLGRFTPVLEVRGDSGRVEKHELDPIWVIPSWWYILLLVIAIAVPLWWRRRSRQRYDSLLARVEAAEARADSDDGDDWHDGDEDSW